MNRVDEPAGVTPCRAWRRPVGWIVLASLLLNPLLVLGQITEVSTTILAAGDTVKLSVPGRPDLDAELLIDGGGRVTIPQVGEVALAGMSVSEATLFIKQKLRLFYPNLDALHLTVSRGDNLKVYVIGQVSRPGVQIFDHVPSLWDVLRSAGGQLQDADMRAARVIREDDGMPQVHSLDLSGIMEGRSFPTFELRSGDTLIIPALLEGTSGVPSNEGVKVFGGVGSTIIVPIIEPMPMLDVLMLAGAPQKDADLKKIYWIHEDGGKAISTVVSLDLYLKEGNPIGNPQVYPGDTLRVAYTRENWFWRYVPPILGFLAATLAIILMVDRLINPISYRY
jgi:polysaccharide export outer membrane protein